MTVVLERDELRTSEAESNDPVPRRRRWRWVLLALAGLGAGLGCMVGNEVQATTQFVQAHQALTQTDRGVARAKGHLAIVRHNLNFLQLQIQASQKALASDTTLLQGIQRALTQAQNDVSTNSVDITNLKACQGGVEQALNALSVGDVGHAVAALSVVSAPCESAAASNG